MKIRFTLRDVFWLTIVIAITVGFWIAHQRYVDRVMSQDPTLIHLREMLSVIESSSAPESESSPANTRTKTDYVIKRLKRQIQEREAGLLNELDQ